MHLHHLIKMRFPFMAFFVLNCAVVFMEKTTNKKNFMKKL